MLEQKLIKSCLEAIEIKYNDVGIIYNKFFKKSVYNLLKLIILQQRFGTNILEKLPLNHEMALTILN